MQHLRHSAAVLYPSLQAGEPMYNRYIPRNDGSFQKRAIPEQKQAPPVQKPPTAPPVPPPQPASPPKPAPPQNPIGFLRNLLPREFDTGDLIIVLLLLLMAGDCQEEQNTALLTLALYFFM